MRRVLAGAGAAGLALVLAAPMAARADTVPAAWSNSKSTTDTSVSSGTFDITAEFRRAHPFLSSTQFSVHTSLTTPSGLAAGCGSGEEHDVPTTGEEPTDGVYVSTATASVTCNGRYEVLIDGQMVSKGSKKPIDDGAQLTPTVDVRMRPANVPSAHAAFGDGKVAISWDAVEDKTPDFLGYQVQIAKDDSWVTIPDGERGRDDTFMVTPAPEAGTEPVYRVRARRDAPGGDTYSADAAETDKITIPTTSTTAPGSPPVTNPDGTPNTSGGGNGGTGGTGGTGSGSGSGGTTHKGRNFDALPPGIVGVGTKAPRVGIPQTGNVPGLLNDQDSGYKDELDYGDQQLAGGQDDSDGLSSFTYEDGGSGRGMAVPVATGLVLAAWAFHFRYLARAAKPAKKRRRPVQPRGGWA